ncbi:MAG TPA: hypothetical protein VGK89_08860 [Candidatus Eisenbacteria bacterium]|jgi:hypothetical protein
MSHRRSHPVGAIAAVLAASGFLAASPARAAAPSASVSYDFHRGPTGEETRSAAALAGLSFESGDIVLGGLRFDDDLIGAGLGLVSGGSVRLADGTGVRALGSRFIGDDGYRGWRLKAGPEWSLAGGSLWIFYQHDSSNLADDSDGGAGEMTVPVSPAWSVKLGGSYGRSGAATGWAASLGAAWMIIPHLELSGDAGLANNSPGASAGPAGRSTILGGLLGRDRAASRSEPVAEAGTTASLALRFTLP